MNDTLQYEDLIARYPEAVAKFRELLPELEPERARFKRLFAMILSPVHGVHHWTRVGIYSLAIAEALQEQGRVHEAPEAFREQVLHAVFFHDCARLTESNELDHGRAGEQVWRCFAARHSLPSPHTEAVSQALLFHVDHPAVDPSANPVTVCLCNADRLDRVRLAQKPIPKLMYHDGIWQHLQPFSQRLLNEVTLERVKEDLGAGPWDSRLGSERGGSP